MTKEHKKTIIGLISALLPEVKIYAYGSVARGDTTIDSDLDIALDNKMPIKLGTLARIREVLAACIFPFKIDIVDLQKISGDLKSNIEKDKILWKK